MTDLLYNPFFQAAALIAVAVLGHYGRKHFGTIQHPRVRVKTMGQRGTTMKLPNIDWKKLSDRLMDLAFPDTPQPELNRYQRLMLEQNASLALQRASTNASNASRAMQPMHDASASMHRASTPNAYALQPMQRQMHDASAWLQDALPVVQSIKLSTLADADNILVAGPKGSGKTTLLRTLLSVRADASCIALDPHASPGKWSCMCIGGGLEWQQIDAAMQKMQRDMQARFKQLASGEIREGEFPRRSYVGDEFLSIVQELGKERAGKALISRLTQGRKVGECILIAAQNDTVESLGIQGNADLKGCFDYIAFLGSLVSTRAKYHGCPPDIIEAAQKAERVGVVWHPERNNWYVLLQDLEPVREGQVSNISQPETAGIAIPVWNEGGKTTGIPQYTAPDTSIPVSESDPNLMSEAIKSLHQSGMSYNKITAVLQLKGSKQQQLDRIKRAIGDIANTA